MEPLVGENIVAEHPHAQRRCCAACNYKAEAQLLLASGSSNTSSRWTTRLVVPHRVLIIPGRSVAMRRPTRGGGVLFGRSSNMLSFVRDLVEPNTRSKKERHRAVFLDVPGVSWVLRVSSIQQGMQQYRR